MNEATDQVDILINNGKLDEASSVLDKSELGDHVYPQKTSDARLTYYLAGYVARKKVMVTQCQECFSQLKSAEGADEGLSSFTAFCDLEGLLYPSVELFAFVEALEDVFTMWFSWNKLQRDSMIEILHIMQDVPRAGCQVHQEELTNNITNFFLTRLHFFTKIPQ